MIMQHGERNSGPHANPGGERQHHPRLVARDEVFHEIDDLFRRGATSVLVTGTPGVGKSAILASYLQRVAAASEVDRVRGVLAGASRHIARWAEQVERTVRTEERWAVASHFLRTSALDRPEVVARSIATQIEDRFIDMRDERAAPDRRLAELLERVSRRVLEPEAMRLLLVIDDLDEAEDERGYSDLARLLPAPLPPRVALLASSRPTTSLTWFMRYAPAHVDLDAPRWSASNHAACRAYWDGVVRELNLPPHVADRAVQRAQGNMLYSVELAEWLRRLPPERRLVEPLPRTLRGVFLKLWGHVNRLPAEPEALVKRSLALLCAAPSPLPLSYIAAHTGWGNRLDATTFLRVARPFLQRFASPGVEDTFRPFHDELRTLIMEQLTNEAAASPPSQHHAAAAPAAPHPSAPSASHPAAAAAASYPQVAAPAVPYPYGQAAAAASYPQAAAPAAPYPYGQAAAAASYPQAAAPAVPYSYGQAAPDAPHPAAVAPAESYPPAAPAAASGRDAGALTAPSHAAATPAPQASAGALSREELLRSIAEAKEKAIGPISGRHAFLVGVRRYDDRSIGDLRFCVDDVVALGGVLKETLGFNTVLSMHDDVEDDRFLPLRNRVKNELIRLARGLKPNDMLLVHFSCHGTLIDGKPVLLFRDTGQEALAESSLPVEDVKKILLESPARRKILFLDACHAGVNLGRNIGGPTLDPAFVHNVFELAEGLAVLAGSTSQQIALERPEAKRGVFTSFVIEGLLGKADRSTPCKGFVTVDDLSYFVTDAVQQWTRENCLSMQIPTARVEGTGSMILADFRDKKA
ncbi:AAA family ATPase [Sorangium sp. So ce131]|uniref:AAA family ATPase n=1 Tax=Sorangium sp. So ce131 TaxID=3133282 RepID=UPI003F6101C1